ncbi:peptide chain release factor 2 [Patescibacteria group bacterium]|nr:MAG: peptide chain release factor 2 [Patescibacteria group bacterium]
MKDLIRQIEALRERVLRTWGLLDLDTVKTEVKALEAEMESADFWSDQEHARKVGKRAADLRGEVGSWESFLKEISDLKDVAELADADPSTSSGQGGMRDEIAASLKGFEERFAKMEFAVLFSGPYDGSNAILSIHAGSGGTEANDWSAMLFRMYMRFAEAKGFEVDVLDESRGDVGFKSITFRITGRHAYGYLKSEHGVHRLVRISPFDAEKMRHTTFALVEAVPELDELPDIKIDEKDLRIDTFMSGGKGGQSVNTTYSAVRIVHVPTGITVQCQNERSQKQNRETAMKILMGKLVARQEEERRAKEAGLRGDYQSAEWGNQIRSYVLHPYKLVKDHRTGYETSDAEGVLNGELEPFMEAYLQLELKGGRG